MDRGVRTGNNTLSSYDPEVSPIVSRNNVYSALPLILDKHLRSRPQEGCFYGGNVGYKETELRSSCRKLSFSCQWPSTSHSISLLRAQSCGSLPVNICHSFFRSPDQCLLRSSSLVRVFMCNHPLTISAESISYSSLPFDPGTSAHVFP